MGSCSRINDRSAPATERVRACLGERIQLIMTKAVSLVVCKSRLERCSDGIGFTTIGLDLRRLNRGALRSTDEDWQREEKRPVKHVEVQSKQAENRVATVRQVWWSGTGRRL